MKKYLPVLICILFLSQSCLMGQNSRQVTQNDKIDPKVRAALTALNKEVYKDMSENNYEALSKLFSDSLKTMLNENFVNKFMPAMQRIMKGHTYRVFDEFYIKNTKRNDTSKIASGKGDDAYTTVANSWTSECYLAMLVAGDSVDEIMLTLSYGKFNGKWQLTGVTGEDYTLKGRTAIDMYKYAQGLEKKGYLMDAINVMGMASHCAKPGGYNFTFKKEAEMKQYNDTLTKQTKAKFPFPYTVNEVVTKPTVVNIHYELDSTDYIPMIIYQSIINVADTGALKKENKDIQAKIGTIFPGMDKVNKRLFYRVYNTLPNGQNNPGYYGYVQVLQPY
ncbi:MAG: hypothetical protein JWQ38_551 [Flavipsychrobacter sp.]|nr:hypothetical protein [Flavipsychrobacter sp.]